MKRQPVNYVNNKDILLHLEPWLEERKIAIAEGRETPRIPRFVGEAIMMIATNLARKPNFSGYSFREEMIGDGVENCIKYLHNFNPEKSRNPFSYITLIVYNAYIRRIEHEQKHSYIKHKMMFQSPVYNMIGDFDASDSDTLNAVMESIANDKSNDIISRFEDKLAEKKEKKRIKSEQRALLAETEQ